MIHCPGAYSYGVFIPQFGGFRYQSLLPVCYIPSSQIGVYDAMHLGMMLLRIYALYKHRVGILIFPAIVATCYIIIGVVRRQIPPSIIFEDNNATSKGGGN
jgi:hypothetical protein